MSLIGKVSNGSPIKLLPHQVAFVETVFSPASKRVIVLRGDVGLGKSIALIAVLDRLLRDLPGARALFLVPAALRLQIVQMLREADIASLLLDRYRFREMLDTTEEEEIWPRGTVVVASQDFAKQPDIKDSLARTHWDLVIVDEADMRSGARAEALQQIGASAERLIVATATFHNLIPSDDFDGYAKESTLVEWRRDQVVDQDGKQLYAMPRPVLHEIPFSLNSAELGLRTTVGELCQILADAGGAESWRARTLLRILESTPVALEPALQRFSNSLALDSLEDPVESLQAEALEEDTSISILDRPTKEKAVGVAVRALQEIEAITGDSKLTAFGALLTQLNKTKSPSQRICVLTEFRATLYYVAAEIEGRGTKCQLLHGEMRAEERAESLKFFLNAGGILVATTAVMRAGIDLSRVTDLILYDIPSSKIALQQVLSRFDRFSRLSELNVYVLTPSNGQEGFVTKSLVLLRDMLGTSGSVAPKP